MKMCMSKAFNSKWKDNNSQMYSNMRAQYGWVIRHPFQSLVEPFSKKPHPRMNGNSSQCRVHQ